MGDETSGPLGDDPRSWSSDGSDDPFGQTSDDDFADDLSVDDLSVDDLSVDDEFSFAEFGDPAADTSLDAAPDESLDEDEPDLGDRTAEVSDPSELVGADPGIGLVDLSAPTDGTEPLPGLDGLVEELGVDIDVFDAVLSSVDPDRLGGARSAVVALEELGIGAAVEFGDVDRIAELVDAGAEIRLGEFGVLAEIDDARDDAIVRRPDGSETRLPLEQFDEAWGAQTYEMLVTLGAGGPLVLLGLGLDAVDPTGGITR